ncbi:MAG TPA: DUF4230 domain-containing protein [Anaerolineales bacterium]|nr:DUF4230 domain-containing protein [Anaerolineales bacterium]
MKENRGSILIQLLILVVVAFGVYYIIQTIHDAAQQAVAPWQQANTALQTQVSDLLHPTPTVIPDPVTYINQIQALARLETIQYTVEQVVTSDVNQQASNPNNPLSPLYPFLFGNKMLLQVHGTVIAGIDMSQLQPGDLNLQNGILYVKLPPAEIFVVTLDESKTQVYNVQTGIFAPPNSDVNLVLAGLQGAKDKITQAALDDGILNVASQNAQTYLTKFFAALGYQNTIFSK